MPAKGSGAGRVKGSPQLIARVSAAEKERITRWRNTIGLSEAEVIRLALNRLEPRLALATTPLTQSLAGLDKFFRGA